MKEPVYIIDGSGYVFRAYYAIRSLSTSKGVPTNAVYGFCTMLQKLIKDHQPKYLAIAFDTGRKTFRSDMYPEYKAHRPPPPPDLPPQFDLIKRLVDCFEIAQFAEIGFEADDVIGTLTRLAREAGHPVVIVTGDKDMMQLVSPEVSLLDELRAAKTGTELMVTPAEVKAKFGVMPDKVIDVLALMGDASDNVPGVKGIGEKTAIELIQEYGSLESVLNCAPMMKQKSRREKILQDSDLARLSKQLVSIDCHVDIEFDLANLENNGPNLLKLKAFYEELEFSRLLTDLNKPVAIAAQVLDPVGLNGVAHDAKRYLKPGEITGDPMLASYMLNPDAKHDLSALAEQYGIDNVNELTQLLEDKVREQGFWELYKNLEIPVENILAGMEQTGVLIDTNLLAQMSEEFGTRLKELEGQAYDMAGVEFNLASPKQVGEVLFGRLGLVSAKNSKTSQSTGADILEDLAKVHPLPKLLLEHRMLSKLKGTYVDALPKLVKPATGRVHTSFNQAVAATGRLSSSDPNLQNIPIKTEAGRRIRQAFIADPGCVLIALDYSQIELRILAHVTNDPLMRDSFVHEQDVHQRTASEIFGVPFESVSAAQRRVAKTINFGLLYGMGVYKLSETLGISRSEANVYLSRYHERYAGIFKWRDDLMNSARELGEVRTLLGRRRFLHDIKSHNRMLVARAERIATNTPIQGTAADMVKKAMIDVDAFLKVNYPAVKILLQVHDELVLEAPEGIAEAVALKVQQVMENAYALNVPVKVQFGIGKNWALAH
ncbi:MAG: DNA polymerase I [Myxococcota bacterium]